MAQQAAADLEWVAQVLQNEPAPHQEPARRGGGFPRRKHGASRSWQGAGQHKEPAQNDGRSGNAGGRGGAARSGAPTSGVGSVGEFSQPGPESTQRALRCTACDCWVPRRQGDWETHLAGIRHRRQVLSLQVTGERGNLVLSTFESAPGPSEPQHRLVGTAARDFGLRQQQRQQQGSSADMHQLTAGQQEALGQLRTSALGQLLSMFGRSNGEEGSSPPGWAAWRLPVLWVICSRLAQAHRQGPSCQAEFLLSWARDNVS